jgi:transcriptional regulator with XRE-family HTH domain
VNDYRAILIKRRKELGLRQIEVARRMGYKNQSAICELETTLSRHPNLATIERWAEALELTPTLSFTAKVD